MGWYFILKSLSNDDITKLDSVMRIDFQSIINYLLILKQERIVVNLKKELESGSVSLG